MPTGNYRGSRKQQYDSTDMLVTTRWEVDGIMVMIFLSQSVCMNIWGTCEVTGCEVGIVFSFPCCSHVVAMEQWAAWYRYVMDVAKKLPITDRFQQFHSCFMLVYCLFCGWNMKLIYGNLDTSIYRRLCRSVTACWLQISEVRGSNPSDSPLKNEERNQQETRRTEERTKKRTKKEQRKRTMK